MSKYEKQCGSCQRFKDKRGDCDCPYDIDSPSWEKGYCDWYRCFYYPDDSCTDHYKERKTSSSPWCYITTIVCDILGFNDDCPELNALRGLRNNVLQKDENYAQVLYEYDTVGPQIARKLEEDYRKKQDTELATLLFNFYIQPSARLYMEGKTNESITRYCEMTKTLAENYGIETPEIEKEYDYQQGGHGQVKIKKLGTYFDALKG